MKMRYVGIAFFFIMVAVIYFAGQASNENMDGMDHSNMPGMGSTTIPNPTQSSEQPMEGMDHSSMAGTDQPGVYQTLDIDAFAEILASSPDEYTVVNVHIPYAGEIEGTDYNIAYNDIDALTSALPDKDAPIILYCRSGNMSQQASEHLIAMGYTQIWDVPGGMNAWQESGRSLQDSE